MNFKADSIEKHGKKVRPPSLLRPSPLLRNGQSEAGWESQGKDKVGTTLTLKHKATPTFASKLTPIFTSLLQQKTPEQTMRYLVITFICIIKLWDLLLFSALSSKLKKQTRREKKNPVNSAQGGWSCRFLRNSKATIMLQSFLENYFYNMYIMTSIWGQCWTTASISPTLYYHCLALA